jgi:hypothetical protein
VTGGTDIAGGAGVSTDVPGPMYVTPEPRGGSIGIPSGWGSLSVAHNPKATIANLPAPIKGLASYEN